MEGDDDAATQEYVLAVDRAGIASELVFSAVTTGKTHRLEEVAAIGELEKEERAQRLVVEGDRERQLLYLQQLESTRRFTLCVVETAALVPPPVRKDATTPSDQTRVEGDTHHGNPGSVLYDEEVFEEQRRFLEHQYSPLRNPDQLSTHYIILQQQQHSSPPGATKQGGDTISGSPKAPAGELAAVATISPLHRQEGSDAGGGRHIGGIDMSYVDFLSKRHGLGSASSTTGRPANSSSSSRLRPAPPSGLPPQGAGSRGSGRGGVLLAEGITKTLVFAEGASRGALELDWIDGWNTLSALAKQQQWLIYDWSLSGPVRQTRKDLKGPDVDYRHLPQALRPVTQRHSPRSQRPPTASSTQGSLVPIASSSSPRLSLRRPPSAAVMVANLKAAVPSSFINRVAAA